MSDRKQYDPEAFYRDQGKAPLGDDSDVPSPPGEMDDFEDPPEETEEEAKIYEEEAQKSAERRQGDPKDPPRHIEDTGPSQALVKLPGGARKHGSEILFDSVVIGELNGEAEDILLIEDAPLWEKFDLLLSELIIEFKSVASGKVIRNRRKIAEMVPWMTTADRLWCVVQCRRLMDDLAVVTLDCPKQTCNGTARNIIDLRKVTVKDGATDIKMEDIHRDSLVTGLEVEWEVMRGIHEEKRAEDMDPKSRVTSGLLVRLRRVGGEKVVWGSRTAKRMLKKMSSRNRRSLRSLFMDKEPTIELAQNFRCRKCGKEWEDDIPVLTMGFFFPDQEEVTAWRAR